MDSRISIMIKCVVSGIITALGAGVLIVAFVEHSYYEPQLAVSGTNSMDYRVFYKDSEFFEANPVTSDLLLLVYVDYIEIDNWLDIQFNENVDIDYTYTATERLVIHHGTDIRPGVATSVFEAESTLAYAAGSHSGDRWRFPRQVYAFDLMDYIDEYRAFAYEYKVQEASRGFEPTNMRGFSAELFVDFTYTIEGAGLSEVSAVGYRIPISSGAFTISQAGSPVIQVIPPTNIFASHVPPSQTVISVLLFGLGVFGLLYNIKLIALDRDPNRREVRGIIRKYSSGIIENINPVNKSGCNIVHVEDFDALLKLSVVHSGHIDFYHDKNAAEFTVLMGDRLYYYPVHYTH